MDHLPAKSIRSYFATDHSGGAYSRSIDVLQRVTMDNFVFDRKTKYMVFSPLSAQLAES
jgi:hypothetical protein